MHRGVGSVTNMLGSERPLSCTNMTWQITCGFIFRTLPHAFLGDRR